MKTNPRWWFQNLTYVWRLTVQFDKHVSTGWFNHKNIWMIKQNKFTSWGVWPITMELEPSESGWWVASSPQKVNRMASRLGCIHWDPLQQSIITHLQGIHNVHGMETATQTGICRGIQTSTFNLTQPNPPYPTYPTPTHHSNTPSNPFAPSDRTQVMVRMVLTLTSSSRVVIVCRVKPPHFTRRWRLGLWSVNVSQLGSWQVLGWLWAPQKSYGVEICP